MSTLNAQVFKVKDNRIYGSILAFTTIDALNQLYNEKHITPYNESDIAMLSKRNIFPVDRFMIKPYSKELSNSGTALTFVSLATAGFATMHDEPNYWDNFFVLSDIFVTQTAIAHWTKSLSLRDRPYLYCKETEFSKKTSKDARLSFYSLHSSVVFSVAYYNYFYHEQTVQDPFLTTSLYVIAAATGVSRIMSGEHFVSDILVGAVLGSVISYIKCNSWSTDKYRITFQNELLNIQVTL